MVDQESSLEVIETVISRGGEYVGHPVGGCLGKNCGNGGETVPLSCRAVQEKLGLCDPKPGGRAGCPEVGQLKESRRMPFRHCGSQPGGVMVLVDSHVNSLGKNPRVVGIRLVYFKIAN